MDTRASTWTAKGTYQFKTYNDNGETWVYINGVPQCLCESIQWALDCFTCSDIDKKGTKQ